MAHKVQIGMSFTLKGVEKLQHDYSILTQRIFAVMFGMFALVFPVLGVTFSDSFGVRARLLEVNAAAPTKVVEELGRHQKLFCSDWAGNCIEQRVIAKVRVLIEN